MHRRTFLSRSARIALASPLVSLLGCAHPDSPRRTSSTNSTAFKSVATFLDKNIPTWMEENKVAGLSIIVLKDAKPAWARAFGLKDAATQERIKEDTIFQAGSMSKPVFAYVVLKLCEKGVLDLDAPLTKYTPE